MKIIEREDYLKAVEIVKNYKLQNSEENKKLDFFTGMNELETDSFMKNIFAEKEMFRYAKLVDRISFCSKLIDRHIGISYSKQILKYWIAKKVIKQEGDYGHSEYRFNDNWWK